MTEAKNKVQIDSVMVNVNAYLWSVTSFVIDEEDFVKYIIFMSGLACAFTCYISR